MSETPGLQFQQFWSALSGEPAEHKSAFSAFQEQLAALAKAAGDSQTQAAGAYTRALLHSFQTFGKSESGPPVTESGAGTTTAHARFTAAAAELQARLAQTNAAAVTEVQARSAGRPPQSLQELFDRWVDSYEQRLFELLTDPDFGVAFGDTVNAALECYRDAGTGNAQPPAGSSSLVELQHAVETLAARIADLEAVHK